LTASTLSALYPRSPPKPINIRDIRKEYMDIQSKLYLGNPFSKWHLPFGFSFGTVAIVAITITVVYCCFKDHIRQRFVGFVGNHHFPYGDAILAQMGFAHPNNGQVNIPREQYAPPAYGFNAADNELNPSVAAALLNDSVANPGIERRDRNMLSAAKDKVTNLFTPIVKPADADCHKEQKSNRSYPPSGEPEVSSQGVYA
jgi:hypothetical protein